MSGQIVELTYFVGEYENKDSCYIYPHPKFKFSVALAQVITLIGLFENEYGFDDVTSSEVNFVDFEEAFGQYENGIEDRANNSYQIDTITELTAEEQAHVEGALKVIHTITAIDPSHALKRLFKFVKDSLDNDCNVDSKSILKCNPLLSKAVVIVRDLIWEGHTTWNEKVEALLVGQFEK